jgi:cyclic beta-1,2-glucan synthetase
MLAAPTKSLGTHSSSWDLFADHQNIHPLRAELYGLDHLAEHARQLGERLAVTNLEAGRPLPKMFLRNAAALRKAHHQISEAYRNHETLGHDAEWLLDNFHIISETLTEIRTDLPTGYYHRLPKLVEGPLAGLPRVFALALDLVAHCDSCLDAANITRFVEAVQTAAPLTVGEIWAIPIMLRLCLVDNLRRLAEHILWFRECRRIAQNWIADSLPSIKNHQEPKFFECKGIHKDWRDCYVVHLLEALHEHEVIHPEAVERLEKSLALAQDTPAEVLEREKQRQAANQVSIGNCVTSLRVLATLDWPKFFELTSTLEAQLRQDPSGVYSRQDFATRDRYRQIVEKIARGSRKKETEVAEVLLNLSRQRQDEASPERSHIGYFLVDDGRPEFEKALKYQAPIVDWPRRIILAHPGMFYFGGLALIIMAFLVGIGRACEQFGSAPWLIGLTLAVTLLPVSELAIGLMNFFALSLVPPRTLPRLDFKDGVPAEDATFIVIPSMLTSPNSGAALVQRLEIHYLSNTLQNTYFGLLTDFADAPTETLPEDAACLQNASVGIDALNEKYFAGGPPRFFLFHRNRQWNPSQNCWMGWERKRGKLAEFNRQLRKAPNTSQTLISKGFDSVPPIRFVITLDTDTQLPRETARRLIETLSHPLNRPRYEPQKKRVVRGYGILQPRIGMALRGARKSPFAEIFTGSAGIDPYTTAVSDTYQDLFGRGSFAGKGIYEVDAFEAAVGHVFPPNHILSHDLIEGNYARSGLVTDIELLDDFPAHYLAFVRREHRWARGDWQILPWLFGKVPGPEGKQLPNPLPLLERWKIFDNLRRSLVPPALLVLLVLGWSVLPGSPWLWTALAALVLAWPLLLQILSLPIQLLEILSQGKVLRFPGRELFYTAAQVYLGAAFLVEHMRSMVDAIMRTLVRIWITKRRLLEWECAAATERRLDLKPGTFLVAMWPDSGLAAALVCVLSLSNPAALVPAGPFLLGWLFSPWIAYGISLPRKSRAAIVTPREDKELRRLARKTWSFFETFVGPKDHWLPPDNYQEDPKNEVAHRTSPTNIGLYLLSCVAAHDFGFITFPALIERLEKTFGTLETLERHRGHFYNWYDTEKLQPLQPMYVSTVDSGNLAACFVVLKQSLLEKIQTPIFGDSYARGFQVLLKLIEENIRELLPRHRKKMETWTLIERHLNKLETLIQKPPEAKTAWPEWLDTLAKEQLILEEHLRALVTQIGEPLPELWRWAIAMADLIKGRKEELTCLASCAKNGDLWKRSHELLNQTEAMAAEMDFKLLYNATRDLFAVGYNLSVGALDNAHYDLLASESSLTSFLTIARGEVPKKHWFQLGRPLTRLGGNVVLLSWGGTMFEYLMPRLLLRLDGNTLLDESQHGAVEAQIKYGRKCRAPWGISESAFSTVDGQLNYQYQAFGTPSLGLKRGLGKDLVVAPYATGLAFMVSPAEALHNLYRLRKEDAEGRFGWYEALDFTAERLPKGRRSVQVKCFMAHHQGMVLLSLNNCLMNDPMPRRFHLEPMVRATELLLQERIPNDFLPENVPARDPLALSTFHEIPPHMSRRITTPHTAKPKTHLLASAQYSLMVTNAGSGQSTCRGLAVNRWREDRTRDAMGQFYYFRDLRTGKRWSAGYQPLCQEPDEYEVTFATDKVEFRRVDGNLETRMEITISPENHAEVRRLTITNHDKKSHYLEVTSYLEVVLAIQAADIAHPAFGKLFIETEYLPGVEGLLCRRRPRSADQKPVWCLHVMAMDGGKFGPIQYETDRARFIGRGRTPADPVVLEFGTGPLSGTTGPVLDPILSLRREFRVKAGSSVHIAFTTTLVDTREEALALADHYTDFHGIQRAFELAWAHAQVELRQMHLTAAETHLYQRLATHLIFASPVMRALGSQVALSQLGQADLWRQGLSGDLPILVLRIASPNELPLARQIMLAHTYWRLKGLAVDLVILNDQEGGYFEDLQEQLQILVRASEDRTLIDKPGGVFLRKSSHLKSEDLQLLVAAARCVLIGSRGLLGVQLDRLERTLPSAQTSQPVVAKIARAAQATPANPSISLQFDNGLGGFTAQGREYVLRLTSQNGRHVLPPQPWINVVANPAFGFLVSEVGSGFTWAANSQANRLTTWHNDPVCDPPTETIYLRDEDSRAIWSVTPFPSGGGANFTVRHGQGYTIFEHQMDGLACSLTLFVAPEEPIKIYRLNIRNLSSRPRRLTAFYFAELVLGTNRDRTAQHIVTEIDSETGILLARNTWDADYAGQVTFVEVNKRPRTLTGDRKEFLGRYGSPLSPAACTGEKLSGKVGGCLDPCAAIQTGLSISPKNEEEIIFVFGQADSIEAARGLARKCHEPLRINADWEAVQSFWERLTGTVTIRTPNPALDLLVNRWLPYQILSCRMWGRSALYQSGGAYGYRDQLQDALALVYAFPEETRRHLLRAAGRQFIEGDVQHWWHPPHGAGVRTRFSDDYLWLPFAVHHYVQCTGDDALLEEKVPFLQGPLLNPDQEEDYRVPEISAETGTVFEHCLRAIEHGMRFGSHGLPLMGTGDWNDGMNRVGWKGKGESVWTGWFLAKILRDFAELCDRRKEGERAQSFRAEADRLAHNIELQAWDGRWYRRAYFDDGRPLGSAENDECRIDSIVQSWSVISGSGDPNRALTALEEVDKYLVRRQDKLVLLFTPPFDKGPLEPGYIKGYVPGIRENGGQYTHAALWVAQAWALLGRADRAVEILDLLNPIRHADSLQAIQRYRLEPYVVAADVYSEPPHIGRGGWSWYTGSASWFYRIVLETILGFELRGNCFRLRPNLPNNWPNAEFTYRFRTSTYLVKFDNAKKKETSPSWATLDGKPWKQDDFPLSDDGKTHEIVVTI